MKDVTKMIFEIHQGTGSNLDSLYETIELNRDSRRYIKVDVVHYTFTDDKHRSDEDDGTHISKFASAKRYPL